MSPIFIKSGTDTAMKTHLLSVILSVITLLNATAATIWLPPPDSIAIVPDTIAKPESGGVMALSDDGDELPSLVNDIVPPTPQAAALARYGEYPVNLSTGIPDISVPIYEIDLGGYKLPVSLRYHASGFRPDDVAPPIGLGWTLNAGGLITRTILGAPDFERYGNKLTYLRDADNVKKEIWDNGPNGGRRLIDEASGSGTESAWDTEADRYTYNFAGHSGVFRYSDKDGRFIPLNHEPINILYFRQGGKDDPGQFIIGDGEGNVFTFAQSEYCGVTDDENHPTLSSWYLTEIFTPYGTISFNYSRNSASDYSIQRVASSCDIGNRFNPDYDRYAQIQYGNDMVLFEIHEAQSYTYYTYKEVRLESIEWPDGKIDFTYLCDSPFMSTFSAKGELTYLERLTEINVLTSDGSVRKSMTLDNNHYWGVNDYNKRMMLHGISDSEHGSYKFSYNTPTNNTPNIATAFSGTDYWGYYNGGEKKPYKNMISREAKIKAVRSLWTLDHRYDNKCDGADRSCNEDLMKYGILESISFPTGGFVAFEFEANRATDADGPNVSLYGGLRVKSITTSDNRGNYDCTVYEYIGRAVFLPPKEWMVWRTFFPDRLYVSNSLVTEIFDHAELVSNPIYPSASGFGCPVFYETVTERHSDGSYAVYNYSFAEIINYMRNERNYDEEMAPPEVFTSSLYDEGYCSPLLNYINRFDSTGRLLATESYRYNGSMLTKFNTGTRIKKTILWPLENPQIFLERIERFLQPPYLYIYPTTAYVKSFQTVNKKVTDHTTGLTDETEMRYDEALRTLHPRAVIKVCSDGLSDTTRYEFAFDHAGSSDPVMRQLAEDYPEASVSIEKFHGRQKVSTLRFGYDVADILPDRLLFSVGDNPPEEREHIIEWDGIMPAAVVLNESDTTRYEWEGFQHLKGMTLPGGLHYAFTSRPLFGMTSSTSPRGLRTDYSYHPDGRLAAVSDNIGTISCFNYNIRGREGDNAENSVVSTTYLTPDRSASRESRLYHDGLGRPYLSASLGSNTSGKWIYTMTGYDLRGREAELSLPFCGSSSADDHWYSADIGALASATYADSAAYSVNHYDGLGRVTSTDTPGEMWRTAGKKKTITYGSNGVNDVKLYTAPLGSTSLVKSGYYAKDTAVTDHDRRRRHVADGLQRSQRAKGARAPW